MTHKQGQAAMEFLMTYGWAILVVIAAIGALAYFGVLKPALFRPPPQDPDTLKLVETCQGVALLDYAMSDATCTFSNHTTRCTCAGNQLLSPAQNRSHPNSDEHIPAQYNQTTKEFYLRVP